jgi:hypothetical protein
MASDTTGFVRFADVGDLAAAHLSVAVLADAGIDARLHGESLGPYPVTIGRLAITQIWVHPDDIDEARLVMLESEIDHTLGEPGGAAETGNEWIPNRIVAGTIAVVFVYAVVRGLMRVF